MMLCLALRSSAEQVYGRALRQFSIEEIPKPSPQPAGSHCLPSSAGRCAPKDVTSTASSFASCRSDHGRSGSSGGVPPNRPMGGNRASPCRDRREFDPLLGYQRAIQAPLGANALGCGDLESLWLEAQSVPSASLVPCIRSPLPGWTVAEVAVNDGRSVVIFNHDQAGPSAVVLRLTAACDPAAPYRRRPRRRGSAATRGPGRAPASSRRPGTTCSPEAA